MKQKNSGMGATVYLALRNYLPTTRLDPHICAGLVANKRPRLGPHLPSPGFHPSQLMTAAFRPRASGQAFG
jgi:hypothetical protein